MISKGGSRLEQFKAILPSSEFVRILPFKKDLKKS